MVGTGFVAPYHAAGWCRAGYELVGAVTRNPSLPRLEALGVVTGYYATLQEAIEKAKPDVIDIASPPARHRADCEIASKADIAFMCQKPLATTVEDAHAIVKSAEGMAAVVHDNFRFRAWNRALRNEINKAALGDIFFARSADRKAGTVTTSKYPELL